MRRGEDGFDEAGGGGAAASSHAVFRALTLVAQAREALDGVATWSLSDAELRDAVAELFQGLQGLEAGWLGLVRDLDDRPDAVPGARAGEVAKTFLIHRLRTTTAQAGRDVRAAQALDPAACVLPVLGAAFTAGEVSRAHVDVAVAARGGVPKRMLERVGQDGISGAQRVDEELTSQARVYDPRTARVLAGHLLNVLDPTGTDRFDPDAYLRRRLSCVTDSTGMLVGTLQLDPAAGAVFTAALDRFSSPSPASAAVTPDGQRVLLGDERSADQRRADALVAISRVALHHGGGGLPARPLTQVSVIATPEQLAAARRPQTRRSRSDAARAGATRAGAASEPGSGAAAGSGSGAAAGSGSGAAAGSGSGAAAGSGSGAAAGSGSGAAAGSAECLQTGPLTAGTLGRLACDAVLQAVLMSPSGAVLDLGRRVRTVSAAQRTALVARDRGCVIPGCTAPVSACDAHHVRWWRHGGGTDLDNLAMICGHHHTAVHAGIWVVVMIDGVPWAIPPPWVSPDRQPLKSGVAEARARTESLGHQLRLAVDHPPHPDDG